MMRKEVEIKKEVVNVHPSPNDPVTIKRTGNILTVRYMVRDVVDSKIVKLNKDKYILRETGEVKEFQHGETRASNLTTVAHSMRELRDLLNTNITDPEKCLWLTLTYAENMTDVKRLYQDFRKFIMRLKTYQRKKALPNFEYIVAMEPQGRGAWHAHLVLIFADKPPFISNDEFSKVWQQGFTKTKPLQDVDNVGLYLTAYLADIDFTEALKSGNKVKGNLKAVNAKDGTSKAIIKGGRLPLYPVGFRLFRASRGIKRPEVQQCNEADAMREVDGAPLTYEKTINIESAEGAGYNTINYRQFNKARKRKCLSESEKSD